MTIAGEMGNPMENNKTPSNNAPDGHQTVFDRMPPEAKALFFRVPVLCSESGAAYMQIVESVATAIGPDDIMEWMFVRNIVDHIYNILFLRQVATGIVDIKRNEGLKSLFASLFLRANAEQVSKSADEFFMNPETADDVMFMLNYHHLKTSHIEAEAVRLHTTELGQIYRMIDSRESRLHKEYRELAIYRESKRIRDEFRTKSRPEALPFVPPSELSENKQDPAQDRAVNQPANDKL